MAGKIKFECLKCGECCRNMHIKTDLGRAGWVTLGLFIMPNERKLFPAEIVVPLYGAGVKGRSRPRPDVIYAYQIAEPTCPHLEADNSCAIYPVRPIACRAFPLGVMLDRRCIWVKERFQEGDSTPKSQLDLGDMVKYHNILFEYIGRYAEKYPARMWAWDLSKRRWVKTKW